MTKKQILLALSLLTLASQVPAATLPGIDFNHFDRSVRPQDDLFAAVNGHWISTTAIPADRTGYGSFIEMRDLSEQRGRALLDDAVAGRVVTADAVKLAALYRSFMDVQGLETLGLRPLAPALARIHAIVTPDDLATYLGAVQPEGGGVVLNVGIDQDPGNASRYLASLSQGGLGMPDRDYYLAHDAHFLAARQAYRHYLTVLLTLAGESGPAPRVEAVLALETQIAAAQRSRTDNRDPHKTYTPMRREALASRLPGFDWPRYLAAAGLGHIDRLNIEQPEYVAKVAELIATVPMSTWRDYLILRQLDHAAPLLDKRFDAAHFDFHLAALNGTPSQPERWKRAVAIANAAMGDAMGKLYVERYFPAQDRQRMQQLVARLMAAYKDSIDSLDWMSAPTKRQAQAKLARYRVKIGYPDTWRDYSSLVVQADDLFGNVVRATRFHYDYRLARLDGPVDRDEWDMSPQTVNAYYNAQRNEIVFPAAILQPPFFDRDADDAVNYGAIGSIIGHEISHGFDDEGSQFDGEGNLRNWWTDDDRARFKARAQGMVRQYAAYEPLPGVKINGELTLGENIADSVGLQIAYKAYHQSLAGKPAPIIEGLSGAQRFYFGFAQAWRYKIRDAALRLQLVSDPHSPAPFRVNGAVTNSDAFYEAFALKPGDTLFRPVSERFRLW